jgi:16S rRNA (guanine527-N7)-methyltransferase
MASADRLVRLGAAALQKLQDYGRLLSEQGVRTGVVAAGDGARIWDRHVLDSLRALDCIRPDDVDIADLGSGGGLPGIPLAIARPDLALVLVEPRLRRVAFLEMVVESLSLRNVRIFPGRVELVQDAVDLCVARAFGSLERSWEAASLLLRPYGALVYFAGRSWSSGSTEVTRLLEGTHADLDVCSAIEFPWQGPLVIMGRSRTA